MRSVAHNNLYILHTCLFRYIDVADFFALFAEAQRAYGTRVFSGVTFRGVPNRVCVVTMYRVCVFRVVAGVVSRFIDRYGGCFDPQVKMMSSVPTVM